MDKKQLLGRLEEVQLKLEAKVGEAHAELNDLVAQAEGVGRSAYNAGMSVYTEAVQELDDFLKTAKAQKLAIRSWIVSNKVMLGIGVGLFVGGMVIGQILSVLPSPLF